MELLKHCPSFKTYHRTMPIQRWAIHKRDIWTISIRSCSTTSPLYLIRLFSARSCLCSKKRMLLSRNARSVHLTAKKMAISHNKRYIKLLITAKRQTTYSSESTKALLTTKYWCLINSTSILELTTKLVCPTCLSASQSLQLTAKLETISRLNASEMTSLSSR